MPLIPVFRRQRVVEHLGSESQSIPLYQWVERACSRKFLAVHFMEFRVTFTGIVLKRKVVGEDRKSQRMIKGRLEQSVRISLRLSREIQLQAERSQFESVSLEKSFCQESWVKPASQNSERARNGKLFNSNSLRWQLRLANKNYIYTFLWVYA